MERASKSTNEAGSQTEASGSKRIPPVLLELLDVAIYSFSCLSGLRSMHKIRGDPVIEGISCMFGQMLEAANQETKEAFERLGGRWGNWRPGQLPTESFSKYLSTRLRNKKGNFSEDKDPSVPALLMEKKQRFEETPVERVITTNHPRCWRCSAKCRFCKARRQKKIPIDALGRPRAE